MLDKTIWALRAATCVPKIGIPILLFAVLWVVAGDERLMDAFARFAFEAYLVGTPVVVIAVVIAVATLVLSRIRS